MKILKEKWKKSLHIIVNTPESVDKQFVNNSINTFCSKRQFQSTRKFCIEITKHIRGTECIKCEKEKSHSDCVHSCTGVQCGLAMGCSGLPLWVGQVGA